MLAEIFDKAGVPAGVFNVVNGYGPIVGAALSDHPDVAMMSFTGSTEAGIAVAQASAVSVKRVLQYGSQKKLRHPQELKIYMKL